MKNVARYLTSVTYYDYFDSESYRGSPNENTRSLDRKMISQDKETAENIELLDVLKNNNSN